MKINFLKFTGFVLLSLLTAEVFATDKLHYLSALDAEANDLVLDKKTRNTADTLEPKPVDAAVRASQLENVGGASTYLIDGLTFEQFEQVLKSNFMGSFYYYKKLNEQQKGNIYLAYQRNPQLEEIREAILQVKYRD